MSKLVKIIAQNKKTLLLVIGLGLFLSLLPLHFAEASFEDCSWTNPIACFTGLATYILTLPIRIIAAIVAIILFLVALILGFVFFLISGILGSFITQTLSIKVIPGIDPSQGGISIVNTGWEFSRDFVNMLFILILVFIGLATILKLRDYEAKKLLPLLIIIALLVNFSGVIMGFVVDISNLVINFFIERFADFSVDNLKSFAWDMPFNYFKESLLGLFTTMGDIPTTFGVIIGSTVYGVALLLFYILGVFVTFAVFLVFLLRVIILWVLAILAPFAFAAYILPSTRSWWNRWWQQLIQWAIIGIPLGLFLVLAKFVFENGIEFTAPAITDPGLSEWGEAGMGLTTFITNIFSPLMGLVLMGIGVMLSMQMAPSAAQGAIKAGVGAGKWAGRQTAGRFLSTERGKKWMGALERTKLGLPETREEWRKAGWGKKIIGAIAAPGVYPARWGIRKLATAGLQYGATQTQEIEKRVADIQKKYGKDYKAAATAYNDLGATDYQGKIALAHYLTRAKGGRGLSKLSDDQQREVIKLTARYDSGRLDDITKHAPGLINDREVGRIIQDTLVSDGAKINPVTGKYEDDDVNDIAEENKKLGITMTNSELIRNAALKKSLDAIKDADLANANSSLMDNAEFRAAVARWKPWSFIRKIAEEWGADMIDKLQDSAEGVGLESIARTNPSFIRAAFTPQGQMFMRNWQGLTNKNQANRLISDALKPQVVIPSGLMAVENSWIRNLAQARFREDPSKPLTDYADEIKRDYEKNYRKNIFSAMRKPDMQALRNRKASQLFGGRQDLAWDDIFKDVVERQYREASLPVLSPKPTTKELKNFELISEGKKAMPQKANLDNLRKAQGSLRASHFAIKKQEEEIARKILELQQKRATATRTEISALEDEINNIETDLKDRKRIETTLKGEEVRIKSKLRP